MLLNQYLPRVIKTNNTNVLLLVGLMVYLCHLYVFIGFTIDDAFIIFKYSNNLINGNGLVYNISEHVNASSSLLWTLLLSPFELFNEGAIVGSKILGIFLFLLTWYFAIKILDVFQIKTNRMRVLFVILFVFNSTLVNWSVYGLENPLVYFLTTAFCYYLILDGPSFNNKRHLIPLALIVISRPEGFVFIVIYLAIIFFYIYRKQEVIIKSVTVNMLLILAFISSYYLFNYMYYGYILPNTVYAKVTNTPVINFLNGFVYLFGHLNISNISLLIMICVIVVLNSIHVSELNNILNIKMIPVILISLSYIIFPLLVGGDWMPNNRFISFSLPCIIISLCIVFDYYKNNCACKYLRSVVILTIIIYVCLNIAQDFVFYRFEKNMHLGWINSSKNEALFLNDKADKNTVVAACDIGMLGYYFKGRVLDWWGLNDDYLSHNRQALGNVDWEYILHKSPDFIIVFSKSPDLQSNQYAYESTIRLMDNTNFRHNYSLIKTYYFWKDRYHLLFKKIKS